MKTPSPSAIAVFGACALLAAGCGGSKKAASTSAAATGAPASTTQSAATTSSTPAAPASGSGSGVKIEVKHAGKLGTVLAAGSKRMTVYLFEADRGTTSACSGACATAWPPVTTDGAPVAAHGARAADLGTTTRSDGTTQVTYRGHPLYFFEKDKDSGDAYGEGVVGFGAAWYAVSPKGSKIDNT